MGLSDEGEDSVQQRYDELCLDLNMDLNAKEEAWQSYQRIQVNFTLEGDKIQWLACALYEACRRTIVPTVGRGIVEGNCVSLTRLLRSAKFSLIQFFNKMKKWSDMANLPQEFRNKVDRLERNFAVSTVIFKKFQPIFLDIFQDPATDSPRPRSRNKSNSRRRIKQCSPANNVDERRLPCTVSEVFTFAWTMFVQVKGNFPAISDDLVNSYHLLLCCIDWFFANALLGGRKDLLNSEFTGLPSDYDSKDWKPPVEAPCIIQLLCDKHDGLSLEAKTIKEHWWKPHIKKLFDRKVLKGKFETLSAVLEIGHFEMNSKSINNAYEEYVLSVGDFDERIFLGEDAEEEIGTPGKSGADLAEQMQAKRSLKQHVDETKTLAPSTPLTGRRYLKEKDPSITPVSTATQSVGRLQALLSGRKTCPSDQLIEYFKDCAKNPHDDIVARVKEMGETFCTHYVQPSNDHPGTHIDFARRRLQLGESLYYKTLENIIEGERKRLSSSKDNKNLDLTSLLEQDIFHRSLYACCLEIVIFSYNSQRAFPWIVNMFDLSPYQFYKVIEIIIRAEEGLSRDVVKHLNHIEETILECLAWKNESPVWDAIQDQESGVPTCEEVTPPNHIDLGPGGSSAIKHPRIKTLTVEAGKQTILSPKQSLLTSPKQSLLSPVRTVKIIDANDPLQSPTGIPVSDRFNSPQPGSARRQLFTSKSESGTQTGTPTTSQPQTILSKQLQSGISETVVVPQTSQDSMIAVIVDGKQVLIPLQSILQAKVVAQAEKAKNFRPKKTGSLALFFRKVYHLASVRLRDLCDRLDIDSDELRRKMWTCFEHTMVKHVELMKDRHLDQLIMCAVYVIAKVTGKPLTFQNIMKCYRYQPQSHSHIYRSVLLNNRRRHHSNSSDSSKSGSTSPFGEERGDLIQFYNSVYVIKLRDYALEFSKDKGKHPSLSPFPSVRSHKGSPRRVSTTCPVYISPHKTKSNPVLSPKGMSFCINKSPPTDLRAINKMIKSEESKLTTKRLLLEVDKDESMSPAKRICQGSNFLRKLQDVNMDRKEANGMAS
ncbi:hypothetical protein LOTGIDRAFT_227069 [Lottia gigantea]|uniref:Retinoblastoma-like protein 1 n=1 Tax=Lottia gigantea TaxID=225164 RepID=V3ZXN9_LOTGI|nr:hypothetical protein LOTGIDRAFT_227069 [Lottia gigantea]ESO96313.1 hypothetical protein LOTGIDRAFT_227069 [Lottia gigantea]